MVAEVSDCSRHSGFLAIYQFCTSSAMDRAGNIIMIHDWAGQRIKNILMTAINPNLFVDFTRWLARLLAQNITRCRYVFTESV